MYIFSVVCIYMCASCCCCCCARWPPLKSGCQQVHCLYGLRPVSVALTHLPVPILKRLLINWILMVKCTAHGRNIACLRGDTNTLTTTLKNC